MEPAMQKMDDRIKVRLDIVEELPAERSIELATALIRQIRADPDLADAKIIIEGMGEGTWWIHLLIIFGAIGAIADRVPKLIDDIKAGQGPFGAIVGRTLDEYDGHTCQVVTEIGDTIILREEIAAPTVHALQGGDVVTGRTVVGQPELQAARSPLPNGGSVKIDLLGSFKRHADGSQWFFAGDRPVRITTKLKIPDGTLLLVSGILELGDPPLLNVIVVNDLVDDEGAPNAPTDTFNDPPTFETYGIDTSSWPSPF